MKVRKFLIERPALAPKGWEIYNAPRPLFASMLDGEPCEWQGDFVCGVFYAAINPDDEDADRWREENARLDATRLEFVTRDEVVGEMVEYYKTKYPTRYQKLFADHPASEKETQDMLIQTWFNLEMNHGVE